MLKRFFNRDDDRSKMERMSDDITDEQDAGEETQQSAGAQADLERMRAKITALDETRKVVNERFISVAEEIGSLRAENRNIREEMAELTIRSTKAVDLVESVQPEQFFTALRKQDAKAQALEAKIEQVRSLNERIREDLKEIHSKMALFRGVEQTLDLNKEADEKLLEVEKIGRNAKHHADKVEEIFIDVKKRFQHTQKVEAMVKDAHDQAEKATTTVESVARKIEGVVSKDEVEKLKAENEEASEQLMTMINEIKTDMAHCYDVVEKQQGRGEAAEKLAAVERSSREGHRVLVEAMGTLQRKLKSVEEKQERVQANVERELEEQEERTSKRDERIFDKIMRITENFGRKEPEEKKRRKKNS